MKLHMQTAVRAQLMAWGMAGAWKAHTQLERVIMETHQQQQLRLMVDLLCCPSALHQMGNTCHDCSAALSHAGKLLLQASCCCRLLS